MTRAEQLPVVVTSALACTAAFGYVIDAAGLGLAPRPALALAAVAAGILTWRWRPAVRPATADLLVWTGIVLFVLAAIGRLAWPSLLPPGRGPDLTHHLLLVDYIEQQRHLVHDRSLDGSMGEMAHYTPGAHLLAVSIGALFGVDGLRAFFPLLAFTTALTAGFVFLIARRLGLPMPYAIAAAILLFLPSQYFFGAFTHDGFLAQARGDVLRGGMPGGRSRAGTSSRTKAALCSSGCCWSRCFSRGRSGSARRCSCLFRSRSP